MIKLKRKEGSDYEFYQEINSFDENLNEVKTYVLLGVYNVNNLLEEKKNYQTMISNVDELIGKIINYSE